METKSRLKVTARRDPGLPPSTTPSLFQVLKPSARANHAPLCALRHTHTPPSWEKRSFPLFFYTACCMRSLSLSLRRTHVTSFWYSIESHHRSRTASLAPRQKKTSEEALKTKHDVHVSEWFACSFLHALSLSLFDTHTHLEGLIDWVAISNGQ